MADFSPSGLYGLPAMSSDTLRLGGDPRVLGWIQEAVQEGDAYNREDPAWDMADKGMRYIIGEQGPRVPLAEYVPFAVLNKSRTATQAHVSALTDIKPVFGYKALNPQFNFHADLLNRLTVAWWMEAMADITLGDCIKYALAGGTGDLAVEWDPQGGMDAKGDHVIIAKDFRDTLPIRPSSDPSPQLWQGVVFREAHSINAMRTKYPLYEGAFRAAPDSLLTTIMSRFRRVVNKLQSPASDTLSGLAGMPQGKVVKPGDVIVYRTYLNDRTRNLTAKPLVMGDPHANWSYVVEPGGLLYPQKRLIVSTPELVLYDGPNPYWHGMYPFARLKLWSVPWCFLGLSLLHDTIPVQDGINDMMKDIRLGVKQWLNPDIAFDKNSTSRAMQVALDPQRPGKRIAVNSMGGATKEPFQKMDGPNPQVLALALEVYRELKDTHDNLSGVANLQALMQLRQMPGADTIQKYYEALTPELRQEGRAVEAFLRDVAQMHKVNIFQYQTSAKRRHILGDAALALEDFDFDPDSLVPAMEQMTTEVDPMTGLATQTPTPGYMPELDASKSRTERAKAFAKLFVFTIAPNSILAMNAQERKMLTLQLARAGYVDFWTLHEVLETPNVGNPPPIPLPPLQPIPMTTPQDQQAVVQGMMQGKYAPNPMNPAEILEIRTPMTITERLLAQQMLGIGMTENPSGRKASGQASPQVEEKSDGAGGSRQTITESDK